MIIVTSLLNYTSPKDAKTHKINRTPTAKSWRMAHDGTTVIALFESTGETGCIHKLFCATTPEECLDEIERLGLKISPEMIPPEMIPPEKMVIP